MIYSSEPLSRIGGGLGGERGRPVPPFPVPQRRLLRVPRRRLHLLLPAGIRRVPLPTWPHQIQVTYLIMHDLITITFTVYPACEFNDFAQWKLTLLNYLITLIDGLKSSHISFPPYLKQHRGGQLHRRLFPYGRTHARWLSQSRRDWHRVSHLCRRRTHPLQRWRRLRRQPGTQNMFRLSIFSLLKFQMTFSAHSKLLTVECWLSHNS